MSLTKVHAGEDFKDLDILASLLAPPKSETAPSRPIIEVLESDHDIMAAAADGQEILEGVI